MAVTSVTSTPWMVVGVSSGSGCRYCGRTPSMCATRRAVMSEQKMGPADQLSDRPV